MPCLRALPSLPAGWLDASPPVDSPRPGTPCGARPPSSRLRHERGAGQCVAVRHSGLKTQHFASLNDASCPAFLACRCCRSETRDGHRHALRVRALLVPRRGGARASRRLAGRGFAPHEPTGPLAGLFRLGPKFDSRLPPTLGDLLGQVRLRGAALNACPRFADGGRLAALDACPPSCVRGSPSGAYLAACALHRHS